MPEFYVEPFLSLYLVNSVLWMIFYGHWSCCVTYLRLGRYENLHVASSRYLLGLRVRICIGENHVMSARHRGYIVYT